MKSGLRLGHFRILRLILRRLVPRLASQEQYCDFYDRLKFEIFHEKNSHYQKSYRPQRVKMVPKCCRIGKNGSKTWSLTKFDDKNVKSDQKNMVKNLGLTL